MGSGGGGMSVVSAFRSCAMRRLGLGCGCGYGGAVERRIGPMPGTRCDAMAELLNQHRRLAHLIALSFGGTDAVSRAAHRIGRTRHDLPPHDTAMQHATSRSGTNAPLK